jgi:Fuc2NAc and GlcNAc transferase
MFLYTFYADALVTIFYRWRKGENLMEAHRSHLYQYMTNELGLPHWKVSSIYTTVQLITGILSIITFKNGLIWQFIFLIVCGITFLAAYNNIKKVKPPFVAPNLQK